MFMSLKVLNSPPQLLTTPIALPKLRLLQVASRNNADAGQTALPVSNLSLPVGVSVHVMLLGHDEREISESELLTSALVSTFSASVAFTPPRLLHTLYLQRAKLERTGEYNVFLTGMSKQLLLPAAKPISITRSPPMLSLGISEETRVVAIISALCLRLPLGDPQHLFLHFDFISAPPYGPIWQFSTLFGQAGNLRTLSVHGQLCQKLLCELAPQREDVILFPNLKELKLSEFVSYDRYHCVAEIAKCLKERQQIRPESRLQRLVLNDSVVTDSIAKPWLRSVVEELICVCKSIDEDDLILDS
ncbi:uncharacterized protein PHACADRAFT_206253 [Phanerochaete carnosa HHB-10118-sp]|uniref:Uncharacterized protein n=1 Tax=Phanerochaete carnosa (strain HHB-10118-sp) TaxID=650164 RepID=K5WLI2_PHACS|nr:uncharacterized protein PHACADRAFT_206253 [Phanerochaete carnosa HHB-10118-sp]EKM60044.1 hypothetical protein PHACADRAFT_206253 [Phanerochaete carnosa HHB-10118-sp]